MARKAIDILETAPLETPQFSLGAVSALMRMERRNQMQRFLRHCGLTATGSAPARKGKQQGKGGRFWFRITDLYRIAIARQLFRDGFGKGLISDVLSHVGDDDSFYSWGERGELPDLYLTLRRGAEKYCVAARRSRTPIRAFEANDFYYVISVREIMAEVREQAWKLFASRQKLSEIGTSGIDAI
jgi:hypothetical protein